jgi:PIN domain nuclease of toxin-antitoxin system
MNLLIDTHILIWYIAGHPNLNKTMINLLEDPGNNHLILMSADSAFKDYPIQNIWSVV